MATAPLQLYSKDAAAHKQNICIISYISSPFIIAKDWKYAIVQQEIK